MRVFVGGVVEVNLSPVTNGKQITALLFCKLTLVEE